MAQLEENSIINQIRGQIGKQLVFKRYGKKTVVSKYPDMSNVKPSKLQKKKRSRFAEAVMYAQLINNDAVLKEEYRKKVKKGQTVYHYAIKEFLKEQ
ncbi:hypothetical protein ESA94_09685 [Lacibacter luteus]|uniref:Uncharacterized protein n=1 Tax=Lacibacter luteus TaxID=2508719 RepID=A0A4Q1CK24_9BACT|nr:hypothetical protein [Lacibacter luteus]RXK60724.1 hypothetical protein ESA94_09685 [Lacibacter luteus]